MSIAVGARVQHRHQRKAGHDKFGYPTGALLQGTVVRIAEGCNAVYWVDFGKEFPTICSKSDITMIEP